jgi:hypothetical protein
MHVSAEFVTRSSIVIMNKSRASAAALSTVLRTTTLSHGNMRFSCTCPAETPQPIKMKFCTTDNVKSSVHVSVLSVCIH